MDQAAVAAQYHCVVCRSRLERGASDLGCGTCRKRYPLLDGIPLLVADPEWYLTDHISGTARIEASAQRGLASVIELLEKGHPRTPALSRMRVGMEGNLALVRRWREALAACSPGAAKLAGTLTRPQAEASANIGAIKYFVSDWGHDARSEATVAAIVDSLRRHLDRRDRSAVAVLGGGAGRVGHELSRDCDAVRIIDLSAAMALTYAWLVRAGLAVHQIMEMNVREVADLYPEVRLTLELPARDRPARPERVAYAIADVLRMPFADRSLSAAVAVYLCDAVDGVPALFREVSRVLAPGGAFLNLGTLGYSSFKPAEMWSAEELRALLAQHGLRIEHEEWVDHAMWPSSSLVTLNARAWSFVAVKDRK